MIMLKFTNRDLAKILNEVAAAYEIKNGDKFKITAYQRAADAIEHATSEVKDLWDEGKLKDIPGIGSHIAAYLDELFRTGKVVHFQEVKKGLPKGMFKILGIPGIGPKTAYKLAKELRLKDIDDLKEAAEEGRVKKLVGFAEESEKDILRGIKEISEKKERMLLPIASKLAQVVVTELCQSPFVIQADVLGSLRRMTATVGDIDIAVCSKNPTKVVKQLTNFNSFERVLESGQHKASVILKNGREVDIMIQPPNRYGSLLQHFTGSKHHNIHLRRVANQLGMSLSEYGVRKRRKLFVHPRGSQFSEDTLFRCATEKEFYKTLGMDYIPPEIREDTGEIEAAQKRMLPELIKLQDIRGDVHIHSSFPIEPSHDQGGNSFKEIAQEAKKLGYQYVGFADHAPAVSTHSPKELETLVRGRTKTIEQLSSSIDYIEVLNCLEVDILPDGTLTLDDNVLKTLDLVLVGIHSSLRQSKKKMTERIIKALANPYVHILSHPTGRLLLKREESEADWAKIFELCAKNAKALEINAFPTRLDLPDVKIREAREYGVKFVVNTDSHRKEQMEYMKFGVAAARRGWCEKEDILNTLPRGELLKWFKG